MVNVHIFLVELFFAQGQEFSFRFNDVFSSKFSLRFKFNEVMFLVFAIQY
jgi:hypothetical protein